MLQFVLLELYPFIGLICIKMTNLRGLIVKNEKHTTITTCCMESLKQLQSAMENNTKN